MQSNVQTHQQEKEGKLVVQMIIGTVQEYKPYSSHLNANLFGKSTIAETRQEDFLINGDSKDAKILGKGNKFQFYFFFKKQKKLHFVM